jgi:hypothetical protein
MLFISAIANYTHTKVQTEVTTAVSGRLVWNETSVFEVSSQQMKICLVVYNGIFKLKKYQAKNLHPGTRANWTRFFLPCLLKKIRC